MSVRLSDTVRTPGRAVRSPRPAARPPDTLPHPVPFPQGRRLSAPVRGNSLAAMTSTEQPEARTDTVYADRARAIAARYVELGERMADPDVLGDPEALRRIAREHSELAAAAEASTSYLSLLDQHRQALEVLASDEDAELVELARFEAEELVERIAATEADLVHLLAPRDPLDDRPAVVEVRAGTGGDEAGLFAADLHRMYARFAETHGLQVEVVSTSEGALSGIREIIFVVRGRDAYGQLRYESGVHRVQRVPATESSGRIHTSAATVAVLPEAEEVDVEIDPGDLKIDVFRSSGPGGQSVNTTDSAVRITHVPTGLVVSCQDEKSQHKNKAKALKVLRARLLDREIAEKEAARARERRMQVGTGDRSAKIRTYNFPQNRVTDHRINLTLHRLESVLSGDLDELIGALRSADQEERIAVEDG